ncbi:MAG: hypothetical protein A2V66_00165 [Ignavibacteria bacterium RBG_13_36_8]|nr:MAG: hypothetical protein A2V66_00165 [Ignavibacteria bacterium RBG_13_36_8]
MKFISILYTALIILTILSLGAIIISYISYKQRIKNKQEEDEEGLLLIKQSPNPPKTATLHESNSKRNKQQIPLSKRHLGSKKKKEIQSNSNTEKKSGFENKRIKILKQLHPGNKSLEQSRDVNRKSKDLKHKPEDKSISKNDPEFFPPDTTRRKETK